MQQQDGKIIDGISEEETQDVSSSDDIDESVDEESKEEIADESDDSDVPNDVVDETEFETESNTDESEDNTGETDESETLMAETDETESTVDEIDEINEILNTFVSEYANYSSDTSDMDYSELYQEMISQQQITNELLYRINDQNDLCIGLLVTLIICCVSYSILEKFCRF